MRVPPVRFARRSSPRTDSCSSRRKATSSRRVSPSRKSPPTSSKSPTSPTAPRVGSRLSRQDRQDRPARPARPAHPVVAVIINPISGGHRPGQAEARAKIATEAVRRHGDEPQVFVTERGGHAHELARRAARDGARLVIAWGGDGTINEAASALVFSDVPFAIIPAGSGNGLARELGISVDPPAAIAQALRAEPRPMDVGEIEGRYFVNVTGIGMDAHIAARFNAPDNPRRGLMGYAAITARAVFRYVPKRYRISIDDRQVERTTVLVCIANSPQFGNGARIAPGARL